MTAMTGNLGDYHVSNHYHTHDHQQWRTMVTTARHRTSLATPARSSMVRSTSSWVRSARSQSVSFETRTGGGPCSRVIYEESLICHLLHRCKNNCTYPHAMTKPPTARNSYMLAVAGGVECHGYMSHKCTCHDNSAASPLQLGTCLQVLATSCPKAAQYALATALCRM